MTNLRALLAFNIKKRRQILGVSQAKLAERVATSAHYIGQIEQKNKFPSPEMLERIAAALDLDSPALFSMTSYTDDAIKRFQNAVQSDLEAALSKAVTETVAKAVDTRLSELKKP